MGGRLYTSASRIKDPGWIESAESYLNITFESAIGRDAILRHDCNSFGFKETIEKEGSSKCCFKMNRKPSADRRCKMISIQFHDNCNAYINYTITQLNV